MLAQAHVGLTDPVQKGGQPLHLRLQQGRDDLALGLPDDARQIAARVPGELLHEVAQGLVPCGVHEQRLDPPQGVVAGGPGDLPVGRYLLVGFEDLLGRHPRPSGRPGQAREVLPRVGQPVGVVDPEPVDVPGPSQLEQQGVARVEHAVGLDADRNQRPDIEEPAVVQLGVRREPVRQPVVLALHQLVEGQLLGAGAHRQHMVVVPQDCLGPVLVTWEGDRVQRQLPGSEDLLDRRPEQGHQDPTVSGRPVDVEPRRVRRLAPLGEHRPERRVVVLGGRDGHVVGDHVHDDAQAPAVGGIRQPFEGPPPTHDLADAGVVDHVVAVGGSGRGLQDRRQVQVADPQGDVVVQSRPDLVEGQVRPELEPVGRYRHP